MTQPSIWYYRRARSSNLCSIRSNWIQWQHYLKIQLVRILNLLCKKVAVTTDTMKAMVTKTDMKDTVTKTDMKDKGDEDGHEGHGDEAFEWANLMSDASRTGLCKSRRRIRHPSSSCSNPNRHCRWSNTAQPRGRRWSVDWGRLQLLKTRRLCCYCWNRNCWTSRRTGDDSTFNMDTTCRVHKLWGNTFQLNSSVINTT